MATEPIEHREVTPSPPLSTLDMSRQWLGANKQRLLKFASVGASGVLVNLLIFELCFRILLVDLLSGSPLFTISNGLGFLVSVFTNFLLNDLWTWGDRLKGKRRRDWLKRVTKYYLTASAAGSVQLVMAWASLQLVWQNIPVTISGIDLAPTLSVLSGIACGMVINFTASHLWAFRDVRTRS